MRKLTVTILIVTLVLCLGITALAAVPADGDTTPVPIRKLTISSQSEHPALMTVYPDGQFLPEGLVTRRELCQSLYALLDGFGRESVIFTDLKAGEMGYEAAAALYGADILTDMIRGGALHPRLYVTRPELTSILVKLAQHLEGTAARSAKTLAQEVADGTLSASGTAGGEKEPILRQELAVVLERLAGREVDETALFLREYLPGDITRDSYAWSYIADAVTEGAVEPMEPGVHRAYNWLYAAWDDGTMIKDMDYGVWTFGLDGAYTTGDDELDGYLADVLDTIGAASLSDEEALQRAYLYVKYNSEYLVRPEDTDPVPQRQTGWEYDRGVRFFRYGGGTCYGYAAAFGLLARVLGENAYIVAAEVNENYAPHGFVVVPRDGVDWIYDVELEATRQDRHEDLELFCIENFEIYNYWYEADWSDK